MNANNTNKHTTLYIPNARAKQPFSLTIISMIVNILRSRDLILQMLKRDVFAQYKKSFLGPAWVFISPLIGIVSWIFMNATGILNPGETAIPYPAYVLISTTIWGAFMGFYTSSSETLTVGQSFIQQVNYPHEVLLIKQVMQFFINWILTFLLTIIIILAFGVFPHWKIVLLPVLILPIFFIGSAIGLIVAVGRVVAHELHSAMNLILGLVLFITPVIYSPDVKEPLLQSIIKWNPLSYLIGGLRDMVLYGNMEHIDRYLYASIFSFILFLLSWRLFFVSEEKAIEKML